MGFDARIYLTEDGKKLFYDSQLGVELRMKAFIIGKGEIGTTPPWKVKGVVSPVLTLPIKEKKRIDAEYVYIRSDYTSAVIEQGFPYRELAVVADQGEGTPEVTYCYGNAGDLAEIINPQDGTGTLEKVVALSIYTENAANVTAVFGESTVYMLQKNYDPAGYGTQYQPETDDRLETESKVVPDAINEAYAAAADAGSVTKGILPVERGGTGNEKGKAADAAKLDGQAPTWYMPTGAIMPFAGASAPDGWLLCNGAAVSRAAYAKLFAVCGTTYGTGDGSTTFNLPNMLDRVPVGSGSNFARGAKAGKTTEILNLNQIPSHAHPPQNGAFVNNVAGGATAMIPWSGGAMPSNTQAYTGAAGGGQAHNNMQPSLGVAYIIKF